MIIDHLFWLQVEHRQAYEAISNTDKAAKSKHAKILGVKGIYPELRIPYHNRPDMCIVDGMHTIKGWWWS